jgi:hypothetical protein
MAGQQKRDSFDGLTADQRHDVRVHADYKGIDFRMAARSLVLKGELGNVSARALRAMGLCPRRNCILCYGR